MPAIRHERQGRFTGTSRDRVGGSNLHGDEGFTLVELMWALIVFALAATAIAYGMMASTNTVRLNKDRVQAANLASREMEITRSEFMNSGTGAADLGAAPMVVNPHPLPAGTSADLLTYTVTRYVQWIPAGAGTSACDGGATVQYPSLAVSVQVTWPAMGAVQPVESHTILTPPKGSLNSNLAFVGIKVLRANGSPAVGQAVNLSGPSSATSYTAPDGCAVFSLSTFGTYSASLSTPGYVDNYGVASPSKAVIAKASTLSQASFNYDRAAQITASFSAPSGYSLPATLPSQFYFYNTGIMPSGLKMVPAAGGSTVVPNLWPFTDGYAMWPGSCAQSDPVKAGGVRAASTVVAPGGSATANLKMLGVDLQAVNVDGDPLPGVAVVATPDSTTGCAGPEGSGAWVVGTTAADGTLRTALPAGSWTLSLGGKTPLGSWPSTGNLVPGGTPPSVIAQISTLS